MPPRSKIETLPEHDRRFVDKALVDAGFSRFEELSELLLAKGYSISKSSIGRYSKPLERKLAAISASTHAAKIISEQAKDDGNALGGAVMTMVNQQLFDIMVNLQELDLDGLDSDNPQDVKSAQAVAERRAMVLAKISKALAELNRALQGQKKFYDESKAKMAKLEAEASEAVAAGRKGLDMDTLAAVKAAYGIS